MSRHRRRKQIKVEGGDVYEILTPPPPAPKKEKLFSFTLKIRRLRWGLSGGGVTAVHYTSAQVNFFSD